MLLKYFKEKWVNIFHDIANYHYGFWKVKITFTLVLSHIKGFKQIDAIYKFYIYFALFNANRKFLRWVVKPINVKYCNLEGTMEIHLIGNERTC